MMVIVQNRKYYIALQFPMLRNSTVFFLMAALPQGPQRLNGYTWARDSSAYMKAPSEEIFSKSTICDFLLLVMVNSDGIILTVC